MRLLVRESFICSHDLGKIEEHASRTSTLRWHIFSGISSGPNFEKAGYGGRQLVAVATVRKRNELPW
jgi:hypothetical protein